jgi:predicted membrane-bound spermidine synthase
MSISERNILAINRRWFFSFFIVSGFCGLVYEVVWLRLAMASFGVTTALASIVISMFMAGLGLGSWGAGRLTNRILSGNGPRVLRFYSIAELLVGISSLAVPFELKFGRLLLQHMGSLSAWQTSRYYVLTGIWIAITLVPWSTCMGSTFPLLMAVIRQTDRLKSDRSFSYLYIANVIGALLGTLASAFVLIELLGFQGTLFVAGGLNAILAISAFIMSYSAPSVVSTDAQVSAPAPRPQLYGLPSYTPLVLLFTTGLVSMGLEVIWIRQFTPYLGNLVYAFAEILAVYLLATVVGSRIYRGGANTRSRGQSTLVWSLLALSTVIPVVAADPLLPIFPLGFSLMRLTAIALFCAVAGFLTPLLVDSWSSGDPDRAGTAYAFNIAGSIVGPLLAGFWLLPWLGERWATAAFSIPLFAIAALVVFQKPRELTQRPKSWQPKLYLVLAIVSSVLLFAITHDYETRFPIREVRRDYSATVVAAGTGFDRGIYVNGIGMTVLTPVTKFMVHLPLAFMPHPPQNGLVICFGMGTSFRSMLSWGIPTTAVDLIPSVPAMFPYFHADAATVESSPLAHIAIDDGRRFLDGSNQSYDVIVVDPPPPPHAAGSSLLYSREFYDVIKQHLRKGGILQAWCPESTDSGTLASMTKALTQSFPYVRSFHSAGKYGIHFLASMDPITNLSSADLVSHMPPAAAADLVEWGPEKTPQQQFDLILSQEFNPQDIIARSPQTPALEDDQPINEYPLLRILFHTSR